MPRTLQQILDDQERLARRFEEFDPRAEDERDPEVFRHLLAASANRANAEADLVEAITRARTAGYSWALIGGAIGTTGQAAQQRYGRLTTRRP